MFTALGFADRSREHALRGALLCLCAFSTQGCGRVGYEKKASPSETALMPDGGIADASALAYDGAETANSMSDALEIDASPDAVATITLPYLQDFEAPSATWGGTFVGAHAVAERDTSQRHGGEASLKCSKGAPEGLRYLEVALPNALTTGEIHSRIFLYAPNSLSVQSWLIPMEMKGAVTHDNKFSFDLGVTGYGSHLSTAGPSVNPNVNLPRDQWVCVELALSLSPNKGWSRLYVDGQLADEHAHVDTLLSKTDPGIQRFRAGIIPAPSQGVTELWLDDWAIATTRIGCL